MEEFSKAPDGEIAPAQAATRSMGSVLQRMAYPALLATTVATGVVALARGWDPTRISPLFLMGVLLYLTALERLIPYNRAWHPSRSEWRWYGIYFLFTMVGSAVAQALVSTAVAALSPAVPALPCGSRSPAPCYWARWPVTSYTDWVTPNPCCGGCTVCTTSRRR